MHSLTSSGDFPLVQSWTYDNIDCQFIICEACFWHATIYRFSGQHGMNDRIRSCPSCLSNNIYIITITKEDIDEFVSHYSAPGGMRAGFEYYRAFPISAEQIKDYSKVKLPMPVLALGGQYSFGTAALDSMRLLATDVRGGIVPLSGHWIPEERPDFLADQLLKFFRNTTK